MKKTCDNCATCPVMKINQKLRAIYDWSANFPMFEGCGEAFNGKEGILCFARQFAKSINWAEVEKVYNKNKEMVDKYLEKAASSKGE